MARPLRIQYPDALYHVTCRGNERRDIFRDDSDRHEFLKILSRSLETYGIILHAFVLMNNHWHFLLQTPLGNLAQFMRHFNITYTSHYNRRHRRVGHLYQGRYKSVLVEQDAYLSQVSRYIHLNPVRVSAKKRMSPDKRLLYLWNYRWSSLPGYVAKAGRLDFVTHETVLAEYGGDTRSGRQRYKRQITEDMASGLSVRDKIVGQSILGEKGFVSWVRESFLGSHRDREVPDVKKIHCYLSLEEITAVLEQERDIPDISRATGTDRQIFMTLLYKYGGLNNREIGELLGVDYSTVSQGRRRLLDKVKQKKELRRSLDRIEVILSRVKI